MSIELVHNRGVCTDESGMLTYVAALRRMVMMGSLVTDEDKRVVNELVDVLEDSWDIEEWV